MISLDRDYLALKPHLEAECARRKLAFDFTELNPGGWGDAMWVGANGIHNVEIKQAGEILSDIDHLINQIRNQSASSDYLWLFVYGEMEPAEDGNSYSLVNENKDRAYWERGPDSAIQRSIRRRHHRINYAGMRKVLWRFRAAGVQVIEVRTLEELAFELCLLYETSQDEGSTFSRLIQERFYIPEPEKKKQALALTLMGVKGARWGEELGLAAADSYSTFADFYAAIQADPQAVSATRLRKGSRSIGPVAVENMRKALGICE